MGYCPARNQIQLIPDTAMSEVSSQEPSDWHRYTLLLSRSTLEFFIAALRYYEQLLKSENEAVVEDSHLSEFLGSDLNEDADLEGGIHEAISVREALEEKIGSDGNQYRTFMSLSHRSVRYLKSVGLTYLGFLKIRRNNLSSRANLSNRLLSVLDRKITSKEDLLTAEGVFANASPIALLVEQAIEQDLGFIASEQDSNSIVAARRPFPVIVNSIELLDDELRARCLDLYAEFRESGQPERFDTVVTEATRILEDRLRGLTGIDGVATDIVARAFGKNPLLRVSHIAAEQDGVQALFRGMFGFIRNRVHHRLHRDMSPERVIQILGFVDYLLFVADSSNQDSPQPETGES
jgi:hypothetical protein